MVQRIAIVTGGGAGIGAACCKRLAGCGTAVAVADIDFAAAKKIAGEIAESGGCALALQVDMADVAGIRGMVAAVISELGDVHVLVNNAGLLHTTPPMEITEEEWDKISNVNLKGVFFACQAVLPCFEKNHYGKIVNMSSMAGRNGGFANGVAYSATKAGVIGLTKALAARLGNQGINVNAICPGTTQTDILRNIAPDKLEELKGKIPLGRLGQVDDIAALVAFLCSEEASFITGATIDINGGMYIG